ncbi:MAG: iron-sulfur cluster assembly accessory protein [Alphaproteobacteria bacterium]|nr:MAG: iron-sulfur cluster assembly accessory protein [Alphaproteobacteria bacterium]
MAILNITDSAAARIKDILRARGKPSAGVRLGTSSKGCNGLSYTLDYVDAPKPGDELVEDKGVKLYIDGASLIYLMGTVMDWQEDTFTTGFTFTNPNEKGRCGCGESFNV